MRAKRGLNEVVVCTMSELGQRNPDPLKKAGYQLRPRLSKA